MKRIIILCALILGMTFGRAGAQTFNYDFTSGYEGWSGDFADYPISDSVFYQLAFTRTTLPAPLNTAKHAVKITGSNHSDDLFMFIKRKITGLIPNATYTLRIDIELASQAPTNAAGVGGAPGEGVTLKAGASLVEPVKQANGTYYEMNIDKGSQTGSGSAMTNIGHVGVSDTTTVFTLINRSNASQVFTITTDATGTVWVCIGSDSGYEAITTLYYNQVKLTFTTGATGIGDKDPVGGLHLFPNPATEWLSIATNRQWEGKYYWITGINGNTLLKGNLAAGLTKVDVSSFVTGIYLLRIDGSTRSIKWVKQ